eukprot:scpid84691/ scgid19307/ 
MAGAKKKEDDVAFETRQEEGAGDDVQVEFLEPDSCDEAGPGTMGASKRQDFGNEKINNCEGAQSRLHCFFTPADVQTVAELYQRVHAENVLPLTCVPAENRKILLSSTQATASSAESECKQSDPEEDEAVPAKRGILGLKGRRRLRTAAGSTSSGSAKSNSAGGAQRGKTPSGPVDSDFQFQDDSARRISATSTAAAMARQAKARPARKTQAQLDNVLSTVWRHGMLDSDLQKQGADIDADDTPGMEAEGNSSRTTSGTQKHSTAKRGMKRRHSADRRKAAKPGLDAYDDPFAL